MLNILYIGPNESEWAQEHCPGSLAASKWARGFLGGLSKVARVTALTHTYYYPWPKGRLLWSGRDNRLYPSGWECEVVSYPVLRYVRERWWRWSYAAKAKKIIADKNIDLVLFYNCNEVWQVPVMRDIKRAYPQVEIYPIILDGDDPRKDDWGWMKSAAQYADGFISLSWWVCQNIPKHITNVRSLHFDGGADAWCGTPPINPSIPQSPNPSISQSVNPPIPQSVNSSRLFTLVHTGALDKWRGLNFMIDVVRRYAKPDVKFIFCGKSSCKVLEEEFGNNPFVELPGFVSEERMNEFCRGADVLLNVRDPNHPDNILNYPSKLPHYLSFGRPVVSTRLQSLAPVYDEVLQYPKDKSVESYVAKLDEVRQWDDRRRLQEYDKIKAWFGMHKTWDEMARGLVSQLKLDN